MSLEESLNKHAAAIHRFCDLAEAGKFGILSETTAIGNAEPVAEEAQPEPKKATKAKAKAEPTPEPEKPAEAKPEPEAVEEEKTPAREVSLNDLRKVGTELVAKGKKTAFLELLNKNFGVPNIGKLDAAQYPACLTALEEVLGKKLEEIAD